MQKKKYVRMVMSTMALLCTVGAICFGGLRVSAGATEKAGSDTVEWNIDENGVLTVTGTGDLEKEYEDDWGDMYFAWCGEKERIRSAVLNWTGMSDLSDLFYDCYNLESVDLRGLDTSNVTNMGGMFWDCARLENVDLRGLDTSNVTNMGGMFCSCSGLESVNLSGLDTSNVTDMNQMFNACQSLTNLDISGFNTIKVKNMMNMVAQCFSLERINLGGLNISNAENISGMFYSCNHLSDLDLSGLTGLDITNAYGVNTIVDGCNSLINLKLPANIKKEINLPGTVWRDENGKVVSVASCLSVPMTYTRSYAEWIIDGNGVLTITGEGDLKRFGTYDDHEWEDRKNEIQSAVLNWTGMSDLASLFVGCSNLTSIDLSKLDASSVTDMGGMFINCSSLASVDLSGINMSNVTDIGRMFSGCESLASVDLSGINISNVTDMSGMFSGCSSLVSLDFSELDTSSVDDMSEMFSRCSSLVSLDFSELDTSSVGDMSKMFSGCSSLASLDLSGFDTSKVGRMNGMFSGCSSLVSLNLSSFYIDRVYEYGTMFSLDDCSGLASLKMPAGLPCEVDLPGGGWKNENGDFVFVAAILSVPMAYTRESGGAEDPANPNTPITTPPTGTATSVSVGDMVIDKKTAGIYTVISANTVSYAGTLSQAKAVTVPERVTNEKGTFQVTEIAENAFKGKKNLTSITIGKNIKIIGKKAFFGCKNLKYIKVKSKDLKSVGKNALKGIHKNCKIKVPSAKLKNYQKKFKKKGQKASVKVIK